MSTFHKGENIKSVTTYTDYHSTAGSKVVYTCPAGVYAKIFIIRATNSESGTYPRITSSAQHSIKLGASYEITQGTYHSNTVLTGGSKMDEIYLTAGQTLSINVTSTLQVTAIGFTVIEYYTS